MALYEFPSIEFTVPHVICQEDERNGVACHERPRNVRVIVAELGTDKAVLLVCDTVDGSFIEDPPYVIAHILLSEVSEVEIETYSSLLKVRFRLPKIQTFDLTFSTPSDFWGIARIISEIQTKKIENQEKEEELVRGVFGMVPNVPRVFKQEE